ncbi:MAG: Crp/Fnr family transcriptional regulator [Hyphomicrobiaceae bacterium]
MSMTLALGWLAAALTLVSFFQQRMIPLRMFAIAANMIFITYALLIQAWHVVALHSILLPFNIWRLVEMRRLTEKVRAASEGNLDMGWLKPFMTSRRARKGDVLFAKGDLSDAMFYTVSGAFRLAEIDKSVMPGEVVGEIGLIAPGNRRTLTFECVEDGELLTITYAQVKQLYYQNPEFGFYFLQLTSARLFQDIRRLEERLEKTA